MNNDSKITDIVNTIVATKITPKMLCVLKALYEQPGKMLTFEDLRVRAGYGMREGNLGISAVLHSSGLRKSLEKYTGKKYDNSNEPFFVAADLTRDAKSFQLTAEFREVIESSDKFKNELSKSYQQLLGENSGSTPKVTFRTSDFPDSEANWEYELPANQHYIEGAVKTVTINRYERSIKNRQACIDFYDSYSCQICGFDFVATYGELGKEFIHVHHIRELHSLPPGYEMNPETELIPVCPNCHAMLHQKSPALLPQDIRALLKKSSKA